MCLMHSSFIALVNPACYCCLQKRIVLFVVDSVGKVIHAQKSKELGYFGGYLGGCHMENKITY